MIPPSVFRLESFVLVDSSHDWAPLNYPPPPLHLRLDPCYPPWTFTQNGEEGQRCDKQLFTCLCEKWQPSLGVDFLDKLVSHSNSSKENKAFTVWTPAIGNSGADPEIGNTFAEFCVLYSEGQCWQTQLKVMNRTGGLARLQILSRHTAEASWMNFSLLNTLSPVIRTDLQTQKYPRSQQETM